MPQIAPTCRDVATIALANASMGDYKLKSSEDYEVGHAEGGGGGLACSSWQSCGA